jgi:hypothetical protein
MEDGGLQLVDRPLRGRCVSANDRATELFRLDQVGAIQVQVRRRNHSNIGEIFF